jgi:hypothetical protein
LAILGSVELYDAITITGNQTEPHIFYSDKGMVLVLSGNYTEIRIHLMLFITLKASTIG